jgi:taurine transport system substrate-binding protein
VDSNLQDFMNQQGDLKMKLKTKLGMLSTVCAMAMGASAAQAQDAANVAFFLEWATPNQIAKVDKAYDAAMGVDVNWVDFGTGVAMTEAMLSGDIDISYSQGLAPFVTAIQQGAPLKMIGIAVVYEANDCFVRNDLGITSANASELEGKTVAVPLNTMADFSFRKFMAALDVDISTMTIVDQAPADGAKSLADGAVDMACIFGGASAATAKEVGTAIMSKEEKVAAGIGSFDVISTTEKFATEHPELVRAFLKVTEEANMAWAATDEQLAKVAADAGMDVETTRGQMADFIFPTSQEQIDGYFGPEGIAASAAASLGVVFSDASDGMAIAKTIDGSFLK